MQHAIGNITKKVSSFNMKDELFSAFRLRERPFKMCSVGKANGFFVPPPRG